MDRDLFGALIQLISPKGKSAKPEKFKTAPIHKTESAHSIALAGGRVDYKLVRRRGRRGVGLKIDGTGLTVAASLTTPILAIETMIGEHANWVNKKLGEWANRRVIPQQWMTGASISFLGEPLILMVEPGQARATVEQAMSHLFVKVKSGAAGGLENAVEKAVVAWMKKQALPHFAQRAFLFARLHQLTPPQVMLSSANNRWGSCNSRREIRFAWRLIKAPPALIDYVVCHELAHLRHMNHSAAFWAEVKRMCPEYEQLKKELDKNDHAYRKF